MLITPITQSLTNEFSRSSTDFLDQLQRRVPVVGDKALIDLINGVQVSQDIIRYRKNRGFLGQIFDKINGSNHQRQILLDGNLIAGQETLYQWVLEVTDSLRISQVALQVTQQSLLETRQAVRQIKQRLVGQEKEFNQLIQGLSQLHKQLNVKFQYLEKRIHNLEVRVTANEDLERIFTAWTAGQTYTKLPWTIQVALVAKEVFSSAVLTYELETGDTKRFRPLLVNKILSSFPDLPKQFFGLADVLDHTWQDMTTQDCALAHALLEVHSLPQQRLFNVPTLFSLGKTLELATLPEDARPNRPGQSAVALCRSQINAISRTTDTREFITTIIEETANDHLFIMLRG
ncbi:diguanylate cyclase regulator RdcB family protein [Crocosphaera sp. XPORK-15E]|uniref:diguanylate cyclase regulator RdcB family protein n=1 Tax=Crocosphaera sp. XPORK-15E TaxID=3110247 RepID=UPI002B1F2C56|nr:diguanylate cyclase regulator RdcB family protein [Crocosphaera sp. XPORK-15E]MEA5536978.1 diguanylate cyclase regulator RdcB family protein [Crocosphaera sp. XPORK-15E]